MRTIQQMMREDNFVPLRDFVRWSKEEYYGNNKLNMGGFECYAQGWSLVYFLRVGPTEKPRGWNRAWNSILDTYLATLAETGDLEEAVDKAYEGVDWDAFQQAWLDFTGTL